MPFQGLRQQSSERRIMTMCLILDHLPIAVQPTPVAHQRAALTIFDRCSLEVRQILRDQAGHALTHSQYQKQTNAAKQRATVLKRVAQLDINQLPLPEPGEPQPGPSGESNGASHCVQGKQRDSTATSSDVEEPPPPRRKKPHGPKRQ